MPDLPNAEDPRAPYQEKNQKTSSAQVGAKGSQVKDEHAHSFELLPQCQFRLCARLERKDMQALWKEAVVDVGRTYQFPGYRKGKVPSLIIEKNRKQEIDHQYSHGAANFLASCVEDQHDIVVMRNQLCPISFEWKERMKGDEGSEVMEITGYHRPIIPPIEDASEGFLPEEVPPLPPQELSDALIDAFVFRFAFLSERMTVDSDTEKVTLGESLNEGSCLGFSAQAIHPKNEGRNQEDEEELLSVPPMYTSSKSLFAPLFRQLRDTGEDVSIYRVPLKEGEAAFYVRRTEFLTTSEDVKAEIRPLLRPPLEKRVQMVDRALKWVRQWNKLVQGLDFSFPHPLVELFAGRASRLLPVCLWLQRCVEEKELATVSEGMERLAKLGLYTLFVQNKEHSLSNELIPIDLTPFRFSAIQLENDLLLDRCQRKEISFWDGACAVWLKFYISKNNLPRKWLERWADDAQDQVGEEDRD